MTVKTRFAPSPTGYLHVGGARTALYSWLYAKKHQGSFILRIEDTDRERSTQESVQAILDGMEWLGLQHDEGPFYQTHHFDRYKELTQQLVNEEKAYPCFCTKERLDELREHQQATKQHIGYDGHCRNLTNDQRDLSQPHVIRFKNPQDGAVVFDGNDYYEITPFPTKAVDATGAGDMFAGAFLYAVTHGYSYVEAGRLASRASAEVVTDFRPRLRPEQHQALLKEVLS